MSKVNKCTIFGTSYWVMVEIHAAVTEGHTDKPSLAAASNADLEVSKLLQSLQCPQSDAHETFGCKVLNLLDTKQKGMFSHTRYRMLGSKQYQWYAPLQDGCTIGYRKSPDTPQ